MDAGLRDRVVLVTGAGGGAGPTICRAFAGEGAAVAVHYRGSAERAEAVASEIRAGGGRAAAVRADLTDAVAIGQMVEQVARELGTIEVLMNATSAYRELPLVETDDAAWTEVLDAMLGATFRVCRAVAPGMAEKGFGRIVKSRSGLVGAPSLSAVVAAKSGIVGLTRGLAKELGPSGVLVNAVAPVFVVTDKGEGGRSISVEDEQKRAKSNPMRRLSTADDLARVVLWLGSAHNSYVNGEIITLSGGARS